MTAEDVAAVEDRVNGWIADNHNVHAVVTTQGRGREARRDGAVRREVRRPGAHGRGRRRHHRGLARTLRWNARAARPARSASSRSRSKRQAPQTCAASRRWPAPPRRASCARHERDLKAIADQLRTRPDQALGAVVDREAKLKELQKAKKPGSGVSDAQVDEFGEQATEIGGLNAIVVQLDGDAVGADAVKDLRSLGERLRDKFSADVVVIGATLGRQSSDRRDRAAQRDRRRRQGRRARKARCRDRRRRRRRARTISRRPAARTRQSSPTRWRPCATAIADAAG